jgi:hypothetical protein
MTALVAVVMIERVKLSEVEIINPKLDDTSHDHEELQPGMSRLTRRQGFRFVIRRRRRSAR